MVVGVAAVDDRNHLDDQTLVDDPADHAVLATTGGKQRGERFAQRLADPAQLLTKGPMMNAKAAVATFSESRGW